MKIYTNLQKITISESLNPKSFEGEIWKPIEDYDGVYLISNYARVKSICRKVKTYNGFRSIKERILKQNFDKDGYKKICLKRNGLNRNILVHRLVALNFIPNPENKPQVNHIKEIKNLNWFDELNWMTSLENNVYGKKIYKTKKSLFNGKLSKPIIQLDIDGNYVKEWISASDAGRNGFQRKNVCDVARGIRNTHYGYIWVYKKDYKLNKK